MENCQFYESEYLNVVNRFYTFWKQHIYDYPKHFLNYLEASPMRDRLSFNPHDKQWYLL
jgi:hypothetical protein